MVIKRDDKINILKSDNVYLSHEFSLLLLKHAVESFTSQPGHVGPAFHPGHEGSDGLQRSHGAYTQLHKSKTVLVSVSWCRNKTNSVGKHKNCLV